MKNVSIRVAMKQQTSVVTVPLRCLVGCTLLFAAAPLSLSQTLQGVAVRVSVEGQGTAARETISVRTGDGWKPALEATGSPLLVHTVAGAARCSIEKAATIPSGLLLSGTCAAGNFEQRVLTTDQPDILQVWTRVTLPPDAKVLSVEDRYSLVPARHQEITPLQGPLDFVWSQNIKSEADDLIPTNGFKSPAVMLQQGEVFVALMPRLSNRRVLPLALDLDVTSEKQPWVSVGQIPSEPHGHSYFRRAAEGQPKILANTVEYAYSIVASRQPQRLGYRRVVRRLWSESGHPGLVASPELQRNVIRPELMSFASWREEAWEREANHLYISFPCGQKQCGTLPSNRNVDGKWDQAEPDAWFNAWFQTLRTAYGWYLYGRETHDTATMAKAESVLNLALSAPQQQGAFPTIYLVKSHRWIPDDGWAGYKNDYHSFCMSWTAYWMLRWVQDLTPERAADVLPFVRAYGDFLLRAQLPSGVIPSWYDSATLAPREPFRDFNAETGPSALFLAELGVVTGDRRYVAGAEKAMEFITREVVPRQRWYDFETFLSCARKDYGFYDTWTAQYPQNNLAEIEAVRAWLVLYRATGKREYLERGENGLDYLLLTQQVWSNPLFSPKLLGGFTTQNTDAEWSDARQCYVATLLLEYYKATGRVEYLERGVAAARSTFAVAPWENWAHTGYIDEPGALTGFHWGTGSAMTSVEMMQPFLGDAYIDLRAVAGVGFDASSVSGVRVNGDAIAFDVNAASPASSLLVKFTGIDAAQRYRISVNGGAEQMVDGKTLIADGYRVPQQGGTKNF